MYYLGYYVFYLNYYRYYGVLFDVLWVRFGVLFVLQKAPTRKLTGNGPWVQVLLRNLIRNEPDNERALLEEGTGRHGTGPDDTGLDGTGLD